MFFHIKMRLVNKDTGNYISKDSVTLLPPGVDGYEMSTLQKTLKSLQIYYRYCKNTFFRPSTVKESIEFNDNTFLIQNNATGKCVSVARDLAGKPKLGKMSEYLCDAEDPLQQFTHVKDISQQLSNKIGVCITNEDADISARGCIPVINGERIDRSKGQAWDTVPEDNWEKLRVFIFKSKTNLLLFNLSFILIIFLGFILFPAPASTAPTVDYAKMREQYERSKVANPSAITGFPSTLPESMRFKRDVKNQMQQKIDEYKLQHNANTMMYNMQNGF